jgi:DNA end-binding protein Ku
VVVERADMVKGYEFEKDRYVMFKPDELKALENAARHTIDIVAFIPLSAVDPIYYDKAYFLAPDKRGAKPYGLLLEAMRESGRCALARWAWKGKEYVVQVRANDDGIVLQQLLYADEVRSMKDLDIEKVDVQKAELNLALQLISQIAAESYDPAAFVDEEKQRILGAIDQKIAGNEIAESAAPEPASGQIIDLMEALRASLGGKKAAAVRAMAAPPHNPARRPNPPRLRPQGSEARGGGRSAGRARACTSKEVTPSDADLFGARPPVDAGHLEGGHRKPDRVRLRRAEPRASQRISLHLPGRRAAAHGVQPARGEDPGPQDPAFAAPSARRAAR